MEIKNKNGYLFLIASRNYKKNSLIKKLQGKILKKPTKFTIEIGPSKHILDKYGIYMNHSFNPNCKIFNQSIISIKNIKKGDELTFNYNTNETKMSNPFKNKNTDKIVKGKK